MHYQFKYLYLKVIWQFCAFSQTRYLNWYANANYTLVHYC